MHIFGTVPPNFSQVLEEYTRLGYHVIAFAHRPVEFRSILKVLKVQREELEHDLTFLGNSAFIFRENGLILFRCLLKVWWFWKIVSKLTRPPLSVS